MKALINKIIEFSNVDGPGNRLAIFFQGCPFSCLYCHNPETINHCNNCGDCVLICPSSALIKVDNKVIYQRALCISCDTCIKTCCYSSDPRVKEYELEELLEIINKYKSYIRGITVSGGESLSQSDFVIELFKEVKKLDLTCLIDTNGYYDFKELDDLLDYCDGVMLDIKAVDDNYHQELTGKSNVQVLKNLEYLSEKNKLLEVRTVLLPKQKENNEKTISYVLKMINNQVDYKLIRYRPYGVNEKGIKCFGEETIKEEEYLTYVDYGKSLGAKKLVLK